MKQTILILGGGYSGVMAALRLAGRTKRLDVSITLINVHTHFIERPRLHEEATGASLQRSALSQLLHGTSVHFLRGKVTQIDPEAQSVHIATENGTQQRRYNYLVYALGSRVNRAAVPGVQEHAFTLDPDGDLTTAALQAKLNTFGNRPFRVVVVGGGATGIEVVTQIRAHYPQSHVALVTQGEVGAFKGPKVQKHIQAALKEQRIAIHEHAPVHSVDVDSVLLANQKISADLIIWAGGFVASPLAHEAGLQVNTQNQIVVDPYLRSLSHPTIFVTGDAAAPIEEPGAPMRMSLFTAIVSGAQAAENIAASIKAQPLQPLSFAWYGQGIALGPNDAVGFATYPVDKAWSLILRRGLAVHIRNFFVWYLRFALELERRFPGSLYWNGKGRYAKQQQRQQAQKQVTSQA